MFGAKTKGEESDLLNVTHDWAKKWLHESPDKSEFNTTIMSDNKTASFYKSHPIRKSPEMKYSTCQEGDSGLSSSDVCFPQTDLHFSVLLLWIWTD